MAQEGTPRPQAPGIDALAPGYDYAFLALIATIAFLLRVANLGQTPSGLHGDEASTGLDAARILDGERIFPYTGSALGQPSGFMYVVAPFVGVMGHTIEAVRLPSALVGTATVIVGFFAIRELFGRTAAWAGAIMLAFSSWLIFYNRTAYPVTAMPLTQFLAILALEVALRRGQWHWGVIAGAAIGAGVYGYFAYPVFAAGLAIYVVVRLLIERPPLVPYLRQAAIIGAVAIIVTIPMWPYVLSEDKGYRHDRDTFSLTRTEEWHDASTAERADILWDRTRYAVRTLAFDGVPDNSDGSGEVAALDPIGATLTVAGLVVCGALAVRRRRAAYLIPIIVIPLVLLGPIFGDAGAHRRALGALPMAVIASSVLIAEFITWVDMRRPPIPYVAMVACAVMMTLYAGINVRRYFDTIINSDAMVYASGPELTLGVQRMNQEPAERHVYFASGRWSAEYETVRFLSKRHSVERGNLEDRSLEYAPEDQQNFDDFQPRASSMALLFDRYIGVNNYLLTTFPGSTQTAGPGINGAASYLIVRFPD